MCVHTYTSKCNFIYKKLHVKKYATNYLSSYQRKRVVLFEHEYGYLCLVIA